jgi:hypothetical protein
MNKPLQASVRSCTNKYSVFFKTFEYFYRNTVEMSSQPFSLSYPPLSFIHCKASLLDFSQQLLSNLLGQASHFQLVAIPLLLLLAAILSSCLAIFKLLTTSSKLSSVQCQRSNPKKNMEYGNLCLS